MLSFAVPISTTSVLTNNNLYTTTIAKPGSRKNYSIVTFYLAKICKVQKKKRIILYAPVWLLQPPEAAISATHWAC